ncbi:MAG TPA: hypothetical protein VGX50_15570 [Longimicrobium sp.]|jgi:hypothetical protein|nr:hypothetical protein [Longimicrobium sp.]
MMNTIRVLAGSCAAAALLAACSTGTDPLGGEQLGFIQAPPDGAAKVTVPATAERGQPFEVKVITVGGGCVSEGPTRTLVQGMTAEVRPYDVNSGREVCTADVRLFEHTATLRFDTPGTATVRIVGAGEPGAGPVTVTRAVTVQ